MLLTMTDDIFLFKRQKPKYFFAKFHLYVVFYFSHLKSYWLMFVSFSDQDDLPLPFSNIANGKENVHNVYAVFSHVRMPTLLWLKLYLMPYSAVKFTISVLKESNPVRMCVVISISQLICI